MEINNPSRLRRSQILVARMPTPQPQRSVGAQFILILIFRKIISHLRCELFLHINVQPEFRSYGAGGDIPYVNFAPQNYWISGNSYHQKYSLDILTLLV